MRLKATSKQLLSLIFDNGSKNHNGFELLFLLPLFLALLDNKTILTTQLMDETIHDDNINVLNVEILHISNGVVLFTPVEPATKLHLDTHHEHAMDASMMTEFGVIMISMDTMMATSWESVDEHVLFMYVYFSAI
jgi:hypothetical protein